MFFLGHQIFAKARAVVLGHNMLYAPAQASTNQSINPPINQLIHQSIINHQSICQ